jgi:DNA-binding MarR family transcriptional regulator
VTAEPGRRAELDLEGAGRVGTELVRLVRLIERTYAQHQTLHPDGVDRATYVLLVHLVDGGPHRSSALAEAVHSDPSTVSRQITQLVRLGLVRRVSDPADGRVVLLVATEEGERVLRENRRLRDDGIARMLAHWPAADREQFAQLLARFTTEFEQYKVARTPPGAAGRR